MKVLGALFPCLSFKVHQIAWEVDIDFSSGKWEREQCVSCIAE